MAVFGNQDAFFPLAPYTIHIHLPSLLVDTRLLSPSPLLSSFFLHITTHDTQAVGRASPPRRPPRPSPSSVFFFFFCLLLALGGGGGGKGRTETLMGVACVGKDGMW